MNLTTSLERIKGVGPRTAEQFAKAGLFTVGDLLTFFPRGYEDFSHVTKITDLKPGKVTLQARCEKVEMRSVRRGMRVVTATLADDSGKVQAVWFNQPYRVTQLKEGGEFLFSGEFEFRYNRYQITNPSAEKVSDIDASEGHDAIMPIYRAIAGLKTSLVRKVLQELQPLITMLPETLPQKVLEKEKLVSYSEAVQNIHFPATVDAMEQAKARLSFEELFQLLLASQLNKQEHGKLSGIAMPFAQEIIKSFVENLPFGLTGAQRRAVWDIFQDFESATPMNRLLQGDVGAGKTVVAGMAARQAAHAGYQTAFMAPTEILARQHAQTLDALLSPFGLKVGLLTGGVKGAARKALYAAIAEGEVDVVVGTHALIQSKVVFHTLGFVVIDEQHRFGVAQRQALLDKSPVMPHLLSMTATPIPRSLALTVYGELDISILDEKPANRLPIITKIGSPNSRSEVYKKIDEEIEKGRQAYVICNLIDNNPDNDLASVEVEYKRLRNSVFKHRTIGLLHGRLSNTEKDEVMEKFAKGELDILVSTTVVEVGVDVPNATIMLIEDGDRFGLAQLHQLRGRVGRSAHQSYCFIIPSGSQKPSQRLREIEKSNDGFYLAEVDLELRGPGEIYGRSQHGALNLQIASLADAKMITRAQKAAKAFVASGENLLHYKQLAKQVEAYQRLTTLN
ncbi:ATP-dependent DNA helicase RecG [Candidatus Saccharibacteria bacterium TM7i]|nr:ATP-dependent DNA helicase RecG [Candidatus Saccharibacteria bacterium TM7i]